MNYYRPRMSGRSASRRRSRCSSSARASRSSASSSRTSPGAAWPVCRGRGGRARSSRSAMSARTSSRRARAAGRSPRRPRAHARDDHRRGARGRRALGGGAAAAARAARRPSRASPCSRSPSRPRPGDSGLRAATPQRSRRARAGLRGRARGRARRRPARRDLDAFRWRTRAQISDGRSWLWSRTAIVLFKAEASAWTPAAVQVQQVWVDPAVRGRGYGARGMRDLMPAAARDGAVRDAVRSRREQPAIASTSRSGCTSSAATARCSSDMEQAILARHGESVFNVLGVMNGDPRAGRADPSGASSRRGARRGAPREPLDLCRHERFERARRPPTKRCGAGGAPVVLSELNDPLYGHFEGGRSMPTATGRRCLVDARPAAGARAGSRSSSATPAPSASCWRGRSGRSSSSRTRFRSPTRSRSGRAPPRRAHAVRGQRGRRFRSARPSSRRSPGCSRLGRRPDVLVMHTSAMACSSGSKRTSGARADRARRRGPSASSRAGRIRPASSTPSGARIPRLGAPRRPRAARRGVRRRMRASARRRSERRSWADGGG